jgi:integrase
MRNPAGYGGVVKLSGKRRKPFVARITCGYNTKGHPNYKVIGYYENKKEALTALSDFNKNPYDLDLRNITLAQLWEFFKERRFSKISTSGKNVYTAAYKHISPLCHKPIRDLKTYHLQTLLDSISLGWQAKSHIQTLLGQLFDIALEFDVVSQNYAKHIKLEKKTKSEIHKPFTRDELELLAASIDKNEWIDTVLILCYTGMRPSELLNIETANVFLDECYMTGGSKTEAGKNRIIPINLKIYKLIKKRYNPREKYLITGSRKDKPLSYTLYSKKFKEVMDLFGMEHLPHDGRHTFATLMDSAGANKIATKRIMGHADVDITSKIYTHKALDELLQNVNML